MVTDKELIKGIKADSDRVWKYLFSSPAEAVGRQVRPLLKGVRDVTFDDVFEQEFETGAGVVKAIRSLGL